MDLFVGFFTNDKIVSILLVTMNRFCEIECNFDFRKKEKKIINLAVVLLPDVKYLLLKKY